jgi:succinylarginine dihydrolase
LIRRKTSGMLRAPMARSTVTVSFDGLVGPTHNFSGLAPGNVASTESEGDVSNPRAAALQGLAKMRAVRALGVPQGVFPPQMRPDFATLRALGYRGSDEAILARVAERDPRLLRAVSSASAMWAANAATVGPAPDSIDGRTHLVPANLRFLFHRSIEVEGTTRALRAIFADSTRFVVHDPLPGSAHFADEGAANHSRFDGEGGQVAHLFAWGRRGFDPAARGPERFAARQTLEASEAVARLCGLREEDVVFAQQHPAGIDAGAFHTDVLAVGHEGFLMLHELAFLDEERVVAELRARVPDLIVARASEAELPAAVAVASYPFNSQLVTLPTGKLALVAPVEAREEPRARAFLEGVAAGDGPVEKILWLDVRQSMKNGGGPACLRLRVPLPEGDLPALSARVMLDDDLEGALEEWIRRHYRDRLAPADLADPLLVTESMAALDELTTLLATGPLYDFQRDPGRISTP